MANALVFLDNERKSYGRSARQTSHSFGYVRKLFHLFKHRFRLAADGTVIIVGQLLERRFAVVDIAADTADLFGSRRFFFCLLLDIGGGIFRALSLDDVVVVGICHGFAVF